MKKNEILKHLSIRLSLLRADYEALVHINSDDAARLKKAKINELRTVIGFIEGALD